LKIVSSSRKISALLAADDDDEGPRLKERLTAAGYRFIDIFCVWDCCRAYIKLAEVRIRKAKSIRGRR